MIKITSCIVILVVYIVSIISYMYSSHFYIRLNITCIAMNKGFMFPHGSITDKPILYHVHSYWGIKNGKMEK